MTDLQAYLIFLAGLIIAPAIILIADTKISNWLLQFLKALFILQIALYSLRLVGLPFHLNNAVHSIMYAGYIASYSFYAGGFIGYFILYLLFKPKIKVFNTLLPQNSKVLYMLMRVSLATIFLPAPLSCILYYDASLHFFTISGYNAVFLIFITAVEFTGGLGLLFRKTIVYATLLLMCDMVGAVYTHYHNYLTKGLPDPLGNSMQALITLTVLVTVVIFTFYLNKNRVPFEVQMQTDAA